MFVAPAIGAAALLILVVIVVRRARSRSAQTGRKGLSLGQLAILSLVGGALLVAVGFFGTIGEGGPELRGGDATTLRVLGWMIGLGVLAVLSGVVLGVVALVSAAARRTV